jgi:DNA topoisomerase-1
MKEAILDTQKVEIDAQNYTFLAEGQKIKFDGFLKVYPLSIQEIDLPLLSINEILKLIKLNKEQHFTQPPKRYTEATLIKELEKEGIGRPSTYAPILSTIQERGYVGKNGPYLFPKEIGFIVNDLLVKHFPSIVDLKFTASMEEELDEIAEGRKKYEQVCQDFWLPFSKTLSQKEKEIDKKEITEEETNEVCEKCGSKMVVKLGRYGKFLSCSNFPACKNTRPFIKLTGTKCPKCKKGEVVERINKKGQIFYGCSRYPECDYTSGEKPRVKSEILNPKH